MKLSPIERHVLDTIAFHGTTDMCNRELAITLERRTSIVRHPRSISRIIGNLVRKGAVTVEGKTVQRTIAPTTEPK